MPVTLSGQSAHSQSLDVAFLCQGWEPDIGGIESHAGDLARGLLSRGHRVHVLCLDYGEGREPYSTRDEHVAGVAVRRMAYRYHDQRALADVVRNPRANDVVTAWLAEMPADVVHVHHTTGFGLGALRAVHEFGHPLVMTLHDYWPLCPRGQMLRNDGAICARPEAAACAACLRATWPHLVPSTGGRAEGPDGGALRDDEDAARARTAFALAALSLPARLFTPSPRAREVYAAAGVDARRIQVVENGVDAGELAREVSRLKKARASSAPGEVRLGVLGSVLPSKGTLELARAFQKAHAPGLTLEIHGNLPAYHGDGSYVAELRKLAEQDPRIRIHGPYERAELASILAGLDGVAAPSRWEEVYGLTVREARAAGLAVLVSDAGGLPAVAAGGAAGLVVARDDERAWTRALERFASDSVARSAWAEAKTPLRSSEQMVLELERAYFDVLAELSRGRSKAPSKPGLLARLFGRGGKKSG